jgi:hypothetical protein
MDPERWQKVKQIYQSAIELEPGGRDAYLRVVCAGDEVLLQEIRSLLNQQSRAASALHHPNIVTIYDVTSEGGKENPVIDSNRSGHWAVAEKGIYFLEFRAALGDESKESSLVPKAMPTLLKLFCFAAGKISQVGTIENITLSGLASFSVSREGLRFTIPNGNLDIVPNIPKSLPAKIQPS